METMLAKFRDILEVRGTGGYTIFFERGLWWQAGKLHWLSDSRDATEDMTEAELREVAQTLLAERETFLKELE